MDSSVDEYFARFLSTDTVQSEEAAAPRWRAVRGRARAYYLLKDTLPPRVFDQAIARPFYGVRNAIHGRTGDRAVPGFLVIGAAKCGTTSLYDWLCQHPLVVRPYTNGVPRKELLYFDYKFDRGLSWYRGHFPRTSELAELERTHGVRPLTGEATASYLTYYQVPARVARLLPEVKLIVTMRNPVDRAYSAFQMSRREKLEPQASFEAAIALEAQRLEPELARTRRDRFYNPIPPAPLGYWSYLQRSRYAEHVEQWLRYFPREQFLFLEFEQMAADPNAALSRTYDFLGLPPHRNASLKPLNTASYDSMAAETRARLVEYFRPHNARLRELTGVEFGWDA